MHCETILFNSPATITLETVSMGVGCARNTWSQMIVEELKKIGTSQNGRRQLRPYSSQGDERSI